MALTANAAIAQPDIPESITTPAQVETRIGMLEFNAGVATPETVDKAFDNLDFSYAFRAYMDNLSGVSIHTFRQGIIDLGMKPNDVLVFSELMAANSLFLTANADTVYVMGYLGLSNGPVVLEMAPDVLGAVQDA